ncbi:hypothetical protein BpHYR1_035524 [Brachionus plicatilis]|uniref:Uncharacterized protein n=1 Tax=Brachionus plicatilis TaxID=10195 RepID=A0A3M7RQ99_BRAPC|nr:hypothetical protein BpHYR1_035524 [Brachionus plicatilis]
MIRHKRELKAFISYLAAAEVEVSITALYVKWLRQYARYTQMSIGVDQPLSLSCLSKNSTGLTIERTHLHWRSRSSVLAFFILSDNFLIFEKIEKLIENLFQSKYTFFDYLKCFCFRKFIL